MKEESQIDEMRAAVRGDRERAEEMRRRSSQNVRALLDVPEPWAPDPPSAPEFRRGLLARLLGR